MKTSETSHPKISIIIPSYNCAQYIIEAVESIFEQEYSSFEVIVVDDGSTDTTREVLEPYQERIRYVNQDNAGAAAARNEGIRLARGECIGFLDADDFFLPGKLTEQMAIFEHHPSAGAVFSGKRIVNRSGSCLSETEPWKWCDDFSLETVLLSLPAYLGSLVVRRSWVESLHGFDPELRQTEDLDFFWRLALAGCRFVWLPKVTVAYRLHETNNTNNGRMALAYKKRLLEKIFSQPDLPETIRLLEPQAWSRTLLWHTWRLFYTGCVGEIVPVLKELLSRYPHAVQDETLLAWMTRFQNWHQDYGRAPEDIRRLWPYIRQAIPLNDEIYERLERVFDWTLSQQAHKEQRFYALPALWTYLEGIEADLSPNFPPEMLLECKFGEIGRGYFQGHDTPCLFEKLSVVKQLPWEDVVRFFQYLISKNPSPITVPNLRRLCRDLQHSEIVPCSETYQFTPLYLTLFGQALLVHHEWQTAFEALYEALKTGGVHPYAFDAWGTFLKNALAYPFRRKAS